jgi:hypothetical protein
MGEDVKHRFGRGQVGLAGAERDEAIPGAAHKKTGRIDKGLVHGGVLLDPLIFPKGEGNYDLGKGIIQ